MNASLFQTLPDSCVWLNGTSSNVAAWQQLPLVAVFVNGCSVWCLERARAVLAWQRQNPGCIQVVLIHVPRFDYDRDPNAAIELFRAEAIHAPIVLDRDWSLWHHFRLEAWPTVVVFDTHGQENHRLVGYGSRESIWQCFAALGARQHSDLRPDGLRQATRRHHSLLLYPRAIAVTPAHLYITDTGHHRILECTHEGRVVRSFGLGTPGRSDGDREEATFCRPSGLAVDRGVLYVADTGNHAIRRIFLMNGNVDTLCGNGSSGPLCEGQLSSPAAVSLETPLGLAVSENMLYFVTAGDNRLWRYDLDNRMITRCAGNGHLDDRDGFARFAAFAQPVALTGRQQMLYVCDALSSSIRLFQRREEEVQSLIGGELGLWEFGKRDGPRATAQLQYPQGVAHDAQSPYLWIADTGNQCLRTLRLGGGELTTVDLPRPLQAPTGLAVLNGMVWIAETAAHAILRYDIGAQTLHTVELVDPYSV